MLRTVWNYLKTLDWLLTMSVYLLITIGLAMIYSVDLSRANPIISVQFLALGIGSVAMFIAGAIHLSVYKSFTRLAYIGAVALLLAVLFLGATIAGTKGWFRFGGFSFQPAEFGKVSLILMLALWISKQHRRFDTLSFLLLSGALAGLPIGLILLQPDLGSAMILSGIWFGLLLIAGVKKRYVAALLLFVISFGIFAWHFVLAEYQKDRYRVFIDPTYALDAAGYHVNQSIIAIGAGQILGAGLGEGTQSQLRFLLEAQTDFIFSVVGEELGFAGTVIVLSAYGVIFWRLIRIAQIAEDDYGAYTALGIALFFFVQMCVNIGGATRLLPLTGVTLPFLSYGGSSLIMNMFLIGIAQSVRQRGLAHGAYRHYEIIE